MQFHNLKRKTKRQRSRQVGRGGKRGKTSGRGTKGQKARAGRKLRPEMRDVIKRLPKRRGYRFKSLAGNWAVVNLDRLNEFFAAGEIVNPKTLAARGLIGGRSTAGRVKILGQGQLLKPLLFSGCLFSQSARRKIETAGGQIK